MNWIKIFLLTWSILISAGDNSNETFKTITRIEYLSEKTNEIDPKEVVRNLNHIQREALLRAIDKLEKEVTRDEEYEEDDDDSVERVSLVPSGKDEILEENSDNDSITPATVEQEDLLKSILETALRSRSTKEESDESVEYIHASSSGDNRDDSEDDVHIKFNIPDEIDTVDRKLVQTKNNIDDSNEIFNDNNAPQKISFITSISNYTTTPVPLVTSRHTTTKRITTTTTTTTTTTPRPTHNEDGENIEIVNKGDIKIFQAPLITAFTVQQDEKGASKRVIPLLDYHQSIPVHTTISPLLPLHSKSINEIKSKTNAFLPTPISPRASTEIPISNNRVPSLSLQHSQPEMQIRPFLTSIIPQNQSLPIIKSNEIPFHPTISSTPILQNQNTFNREPISTVSSSVVGTQQSTVFNDYLLERQRLLEQQIYQLQLQARQQQEQIILQQRLLLEQQQKSNQLKSANNNFKNDFLTIRPSVEVITSVTPVPLSSSTRYEFNTHLQLPVREAAIFRPNVNDHFANSQPLPPIQNQPVNKFNFQNSQSSQPPELSAFQRLPQKSFQIFNLQSPSLSSFGSSINKSSLVAPDQQQHLRYKNRHFRQEAGTGNFGLNNNFSNTNQNNFLRFLDGQGNGENPIQNQQHFPNSALNNGLNSLTPPNFHFSGHHNTGRF